MGGDEGLKHDIRLDQIYVELDTETHPVFFKRGRHGYDQFVLLQGARTMIMGLLRLTALEVATIEQRLVFLGDPGKRKKHFS